MFQRTLRVWFEVSATKLEHESPNDVFIVGVYFANIGDNEQFDDNDKLYDNDMMIIR